MKLDENLCVNCGLHPNSLTEQKEQLSEVTLRCSASVASIHQILPHLCTGSSGNSPKHLIHRIWRSSLFDGHLLTSPYWQSQGSASDSSVHGEEPSLDLQFDQQLFLSEAMSFTCEAVLLDKVNPNHINLMDVPTSAFESASTRSSSVNRSFATRDSQSPCSTRSIVSSSIAEKEV